MPEYNMYIPI